MKRAGSKESLKSSGSATSNASSYYPANCKRIEESARPDFNYDIVDQLGELASEFDAVDNRCISFIQNGWLRTHNLSTLKKLEIFLCVLLLPLRFGTFLLCFISLILLSKLATVGLKIDNPPQPDIYGFRTILLYICFFLWRIMNFSAGVYYVEITGKKASPAEAPIQVMAPHSTFLDPSAVVNFPFCGAPSPIATSDGLGTNNAMRLINAIFVDRYSSQSRKNLIEEMCRRAETPELGWRSLIIFPEGTCGNRTAINYFKPGAFLPGKPVQPIFLDIPRDSEFDVSSWSFIAPKSNVLVLMLSIFLKIYYPVTLNYLPVYKPSEEEKNDPYLYAYNVRKVIADFAGLPFSDISLDDGKVMDLVKKENIDPRYTVVEAERLYRDYGIRYRELKTLVIDYLVNYRSCIDKKTARCTVRSFAERTKIPEKSLENEYFRGLPGFNDGIISLGVGIEAILRARQNVNSYEIENSINTEKILKLMDNKDLNSPEKMHEFLLKNPCYTLLRK